MANFKPIGTFSFPNASDGYDRYGRVYNLNLSPKGNFLSGIRDGSHDDPFSPDHRVPYDIAAFYLLDLDNGGVRYTEQSSGFTYGVSESKPVTPSIITFSKDDTVFACSKGKTITWQNLNRKGDRAHHIRPEISNGSISALALDASGQSIAYSVKNQIYLWDLEGEALTDTLPEGCGLINAMTFSPDGSHLAYSASSSTGNQISVWNLKTRALTFSSDYPDEVTVLTFSMDGRWLASGAHTTIQILDVQANSPITRLNGLDRTVKSLLFTRNTKFLVVTYDAVIQYWNLSQHQIAKTVEMNAIFSQDGLTAVVPKEEKDAVDVFTLQRSA